MGGWSLFTPRHGPPPLMAWEWDKHCLLGGAKRSTRAESLAGHPGPCRGGGRAGRDILRDKAGSGPPRHQRRKQPAALVLRLGWDWCVFSESAEAWWGLSGGDLGLGLGSLVT